MIFDNKQSLRAFFSVKLDLNVMLIARMSNKKL